MAHELLLAGTASDADFMTLIKTYSTPSGPKFMLLETHPRKVVEQNERQDLLYFAPFHPNFDFTPYTSGRIFHHHGELRWERLHPLVQIVYTGDVAYQPVLTAMKETRQEQLDHCDPISRKYILFGKRLNDEQVEQIGSAAQKGDSAEVRIPRLLRYPAPAGAERVQLEVYEYIHRVTGANIAYRFYDLVRFEKSKQIVQVPQGQVSQELQEQKNA